MNYLKINIGDEVTRIILTGIYSQSILFIMKGISSLNVIVLQNYVGINVSMLFLTYFLMSMIYIYFFSKVDNWVFSTTGKDLGILAVFLDLVKDTIPVV